MGRSVAVTGLQFEGQLRPQVEAVGADWPLYEKCLSRLIRDDMTSAEVDLAIMWASFDYHAEAYNCDMVHIPLHHLPMRVHG